MKNLFDIVSHFEIQGTISDIKPLVFPYGTRMYVQTVKGSWHYGMATAADCGTAIKGNKIDLWFKTYSEACDWGRRDCTVYVLD